MSAKADKTGSCSFCGQTKIIQVPKEIKVGGSGILGIE